MAAHNELGKEAENKAVEYLLRIGYKIIERNWFYKKAEIDIIATFQNELIIVEVKARSKIGILRPEDAVNNKKKNLLIKATDEFIQQNNIIKNIRFDIISVIKNTHNWEINHIKDAFNMIF